MKVRIVMVQTVVLLLTSRIQGPQNLPTFTYLRHLRLTTVLTANAIYIQLLANDPEEIRIHCGGTQPCFVAENIRHLRSIAIN
jgi:hypothetical protein